MQKIYKKLTDEQKKQGVIFSSCLSKFRTEEEKDTIHEVLKNDEDKTEVITRLKNDKFFNASHFIFNIIRT